jgi:DNA-binding MarR family transcriptional regulator
MLKKARVTPARFDALYVLFERGAMRQSTLQRALGVVRSTASELLRDLERLRLVTRGARCRTGRDVQITREGRDVVDRAFAAQMAVDDAITHAFGRCWLRATLAKIVLLERFCRNLRRASDDVGYARVYDWLAYDD